MSRRKPMFNLSLSISATIWYVRLLQCYKANSPSAEELGPELACKYDSGYVHCREQVWHLRLEGGRIRVGGIAEGADELAQHFHALGRSLSSWTISMYHGCVWQYRDLCTKTKSPSQENRTKMRRFHVTAKSAAASPKQSNSGQKSKKTR